MRRSWPRLVAACAVTAGLVAACAPEADQEPLVASSPGPGSSGPAPANDPRATAEAAIGEVVAYWERTYPQVYGTAFEPLAGGVHPYGPSGQLPPPCGGVAASYEDIADNAFYCPGDDYVAWDEVSLIPRINEQFGALIIGVVFAHEFGHAIQFRAGVEGRTIDLEQQADCFAGAWTADVAAGNSRTFQIDEATLDASVAGIVAISDLPGTSGEDALAHGSGFDRIGAFQDGFENGPERCAGYEQSPPATVEIPFTAEDAGTSGNMALEDGPRAPEGVGLLSRVEVDLNHFYGLLFDELEHTFRPVDDLLVVDPGGEEVGCGGDTLGGDELSYAARYCEDENVVVIDGPGLVEDLYQIGDFAVAAEIARMWAVAAQTQLGVGPGRDANLQADCLTGVWAFARFPASGVPSSQLTMSAGDLDEGIIGFLAYGASEESGTVFERTDALRSGFLQSYRACEEYAPFA